MGAVIADDPDLRLGVGCKMVDRNNDRNAEFLHVLNVNTEVCNALVQCVDVLSGQFSLRHTAVVFECADGRNQHDAGRLDARIPALDV